MGTNFSTQTVYGVLGTDVKDYDHHDRDEDGNWKGWEVFRLDEYESFHAENVIVGISIGRKLVRRCDVCPIFETADPASLLKYKDQMEQDLGAAPRLLSFVSVS
jgi:hypothetical protein